jgi:hypothetical protein
LLLTCDNLRVKRPTSSYVIAITALILASFAAIQSLFFSTQEAGVDGLAIIALLLGIIFCYYVVPKVELHSDRIVILNPLLRYEIGYGAIENVDTRFALNLSGEFGKVSAWAAPAPGRHRHRSHSSEDFRTLGLKPDQSVRPSDMPSTITGSLAMQIRRFQAEGGHPASFEKRANLLGIALLVVPAVLVAITQL